MNHLALIEKTQTLIAAGDIVGAESALVELADTEGDAALMVLLALGGQLRELLLVAPCRFRAAGNLRGDLDVHGLLDALAGVLRAADPLVELLDSPRQLGHTLAVSCLDTLFVLLLEPRLDSTLS